jgi:2',3'-cyclic-nucleotide 2'-phosphodiesterase/3'-nucleotidase
LGRATLGQAVVAGMNLMGYDAMALGPRELALGPEVLRERMAEAEFPILSANVVLEDSGQLLAEPYTLLPLGDQRVAVLGLTRPPDDPVAGFQALDPQEAAARYLPELDQQAGTIVVLTNLDTRSALALADALPGIDLVVAGLPDHFPDQAVRAPTTGTLVVSADQPSPGHTGRWVGRLAVAVDRDGRLRDDAWVSVPLDSGIPDDPDMAALLDTFRQ